MPKRICDARVTRLASAIARAGGVVTFATAMAILQDTKQATSRALIWLVKAGMLRKVWVPGGTHVWMSERELVRTVAPGEKPAVYCLSRKSDGRWAPGRTFDHDQLALRVLFSLAAHSDLLTEREIRATGRWRGRTPDGIVRMNLPGREAPAIVELETERSRKSGAVEKEHGALGGWAKLAIRTFRVAHDRANSRQQTSIGLTETTMVVASLSHLRSIERKIIEVRSVNRASNSHWKAIDPTPWYAVELDDNDEVVGLPHLILTDDRTSRSGQATNVVRVDDVIPEGWL